MTGLVLKLKPNEKVLVNGILLQNGSRAARIRVRTGDVSILRSRDAITQDEANTPLKRLYYIAQLALAGEADASEAAQQINDGIDQLEDVFSKMSVDELTRARKAAKAGKFFIVMRAVKKLFPVEQTLLDHPLEPMEKAGAA